MDRNGRNFDRVANISKDEKSGSVNEFRKTKLLGWQIFSKVNKMVFVVVVLMNI